MGSTHVGEQLLFSIVSSILTFYFDLILGSFLAFWGPNGLFLGWIGLKAVWGLLILTSTFCFLSFALFLLYNVVLSSYGGRGGRWWW